jgi:hypothetical protein
MSKYAAELGDTIYDIVRKRLAYEDDDRISGQIIAVRQRMHRDWEARQHKGHQQIQVTINTFNSMFKVGDAVIVEPTYEHGSFECVVLSPSTYHSDNSGAQYAVVRLQGWTRGRDHYGGREAFILDDGTHFFDNQGKLRHGCDGTVLPGA